VVSVISRRNISFLLHFLFNITLSFISSFIPKEENKVLFHSTPDFSDNPRYVYEIIKDKKNYRIVWAVYDKTQFKNSGNTIFVKYGTLDYFYHLVTSKYLVLSHGVPYGKARNQIAILAWHGIALKAEGYYKKLKLNLAEKINFMITRKRVDYFIVPSEFTRIIFSSIFQIPPHKFYVLGQPRCDALFKSREEGICILSKIIKEKIDANTKIVAYLPTFRLYDRKSMEKIVSCLFTSEKFREFLVKNDLIFLYKPHIKDEIFVKKISKVENIKIISNDELKRYKLTVYDFLSAVDVLITDYSSVYFDFLLLNRPIVFYVPDFEEYHKERGFTLEPFDFWTPGKKAKTIDELIEALKEAIKNPKNYEYERTHFQNLFFKYKDRRSSERVAKIILK